MSSATAKDLKQPKRLNVRRVIKTLDQLYEFGPSRYYDWFKTIEDAFSEFEASISDLTIGEINLGISRIEAIDPRKRISPLPEDFSKICTASDSSWNEIQENYKDKVETVRNPDWFKVVIEEEIDFGENLSGLTIGDIHLGFERLEEINPSYKISSSPEDFFRICSASEENWNSMKDTYRNTETFGKPKEIIGIKQDRNQSALNILLAMLERNFLEVDDLIEVNNFPIASDFKSLDLELSEPKSPFGLTSKIAEILIEKGLFEIRIYSRDTKERWNPLRESFIEFRKRLDNVHAYYDIRSSPDLFEVKEWVDGFFI
ncbi:hypothetical protein CYQ88_08435 [Hydrogenovibrio sp. SC-1]|uniref:hypothetical protein n=1 Tax=Hydrogenovibrio sp. SC-1 TaxID=2065820 RepID=UPI000C7A3BFB|nr:hypothetical protein [Hydrogenovibrio sp. SC-1]PLA73982.1 hypothetical protein CYQ88_08435 [Hydrogenovibrio sp. SC-1]